MRTTGPSPAELAKISKRVCVVAGPAKAPALAAVLRSGAVTDLVLDDECAQAVLDLELRRRGRRMR
jgi:hypothetical protein